MGGLVPLGTVSAARRPPRFRVRAEPASWSPGQPASFQVAGAGCWVAAARLVTLQCVPGSQVTFYIVLDRPGTNWTASDLAATALITGPLSGRLGSFDVTVQQLPPEAAGNTLWMLLTLGVSEAVGPGRYKGPVEVRCGQRVEPFALLLDVLEI